MGEIEKLELWRDGDTSLSDDMAAADFYCELIVINNRSTEKWFYFPVLRWLAPDSSARSWRFNTLLSQICIKYSRVITCQSNTSKGRGRNRLPT